MAQNPVEIPSIVLLISSHNDTLVVPHTNQIGSAALDQANSLTVVRAAKPLMEESTETTTVVKETRREVVHNRCVDVVARGVSMNC